DARVVISELVANSVRHATTLSDGQIHVSWVLEPRGLDHSVTDGGSSTRPHKVNAPSSALAERGMAIVETLALEWWSERTGSPATPAPLRGLPAAGPPCTPCSTSESSFRRGRARHPARPWLGSCAMGKKSRVKARTA